MRGPRWTRYNVRSLRLFGSVWPTPDDLDPSDHPLYLGPGPTQQPTPAAGVRKIAHMSFVLFVCLFSMGKGLERDYDFTALTHRRLDKRVLFLHMSWHKENFKTAMCFPLTAQNTPSRHMINLSYFYIVHQRQKVIHVAWQIFI